MLVNHDAIFLESTITIAIKFFGKETFRMTKWIRRIIDDDIVVIFTISQKA